MCSIRGMLGIHFQVQLARLPLNGHYQTPLDYSKPDGVKAAIALFKISSSTEDLCCSTQVHHDTIDLTLGTHHLNVTRWPWR